ncbi:DUF5719 family protein [Kitasatospora sp. NPDC059571]|uniref:DUF5719 family protein n=1 Tax=Kitasatospora sp. NPDC059571 TaxID=3346871 RepID=UPI0036975194
MKKPSIKAPALKAPKLAEGLRRPGFGGGLPGGSRTGQSLLAAAAVLGLVFGIAELRPPAQPTTAGPHGAPTTAQVERTAAVCPPPRQGLTGTTALTLFNPAGSTAKGTGSLSDVAPPSAAAPAPSSAAPSGSASGSPSAQPAAAAGAPAARLTLAKSGVPVTGTAASGDTTATGATATGGFAPGFTVSQTTTMADQSSAGLAGVTCAEPGSDFWFVGASTAASRRDYVTLVNTDSSPATVDVRLVGDKGPIDSDNGTGISLAPGTSQSLLLSTMLKTETPDLAVHVVARGGRVAAGLEAAEEGKGVDWIAASAAPAATQVIPGLPADRSAARLVVAAPADDDADLKIQISGKNGWFTPAGKETLHVKAGMVAALDLGGGANTRSEVGAIRLSPSDPAHPTPIVATVRVDRSNNGKSEAAWIAAAGPVGKRASIADNRGGGATSVLLTSTGTADAKVRLTASAGSGGGTPATKEVDVPAGATVAVQGLEPAGLNGTYGITVETLSGGPVVAARMLAVNQKELPAFTIQALQDDHSTVVVPFAQNDPGLLLR